MLYTLAVQIYGIAIRLAALRNPKARKWVAGRRGWRASVRKIAQEKGKLLWFHCASVGEFEQGRPVLESLRVQFPEARILVSFFSPSGYELHRDYPHADHVLYLPLDTPANSRYWVRTLQPSLVVFVKYEFWFNLLRVLKREQVPTYLISAHFRPTQFFFRPWARPFLKRLNDFRTLFVQRESSVKLLQEHGITAPVIVSGDTRFDRVSEICRDSSPLPDMERFLDGSPLMIGGSTWPTEEEYLIRYLRQAPTDWKYLIAPHEMDEARIQYLLESLGPGATRYSHWEQTPDAEANILLVDGYGYLSRLYRYGSLAVVGGGFQDGIHNILEPATFGMPVCFGPAYDKFAEAHDLMALGTARSFESYEECTTILKEWQADAAQRDELAEKARHYVQAHVGATETIVQALAEAWMKA
ncbi:MAG: 3-deoxy-D-manno-octulosonic acid transferase [Leptolyngbya sp. SIO3F4]|nr:3-deoxy-D-manno-octulosonic acid transferase [Leptolyngbya sp. SIO3F4]